ncbi:PadR family transcriptional regulator [Nocardia sp. ET3-3]|uniref:PadR family transcriptional regulator n=1 Tax=Nocardia terrae TaxID=2675851 RepID=A0A7K1UQF0_9NOCA|nr:PadR family transcriptional regulator [Nocardia terrae]MVU76379.1 PadR family transcriptional regulator [Nocardia terrae]
MSVPTTRLLVLAVVRLLQPVHGYDVRRELLSWNADNWANVKPGSIYSALNTLERDGLISVEGVGQEGARPERRTYRLMPEGEKEFGAMLRGSLFEADLVKHPYFAAVALFPQVPKAEVMAALRARILKFEADLLQFENEIGRILSGSGDPRESTPHHVVYSIRLAAAHARADLEWSRQTLKGIEDGELDAWSGSMGGVPVPPPIG